MAAVNLDFAPTIEFSPSLDLSVDLAPRFDPTFSANFSPHFESRFAPTITVSPSFTFSPEFSPAFDLTFAPVFDPVFAPEFSPTFAPTLKIGDLGDVILNESVESAMKQLDEQSPHHSAIEVGQLNPTHELDLNVMRALGATGGIVGAPLGFLPYLTDCYSGLGKHAQRSSQYVYTPNDLTVDQYIQAERRGFLEDGKFDEYLQFAGLSDDNRETVKKLMWQLPTVQDVVSWQAREVFEADAINKYGLDDEFGNLDLSLFQKVGVAPDMARNYWRAHWQHPSFGQMVEMLRRGAFKADGIKAGELSEDSSLEALEEYGTKELYEWYRLVEVPPHWRDKLTATTWAVPTRVDVRRWWDMRTIDEPRMRELYTAMGYHGKDLEDYVLWTKVYTDFPDLVARYKNGWITEEDVFNQLVSFGMPENRAGELLETKIKNTAGPERVTKERDLTKSEIVKGVKKEHITWEEGIALLVQLGYDEWEADYILAIQIESQGSPETPLEYRELVEKHRRSQGMTSKEVPAEVKAAEKAFLAAKKAVADKQTEGAPQEDIDELEVRRVDASLAYREMLIKHGL